jgi:hypothetical protein
MRPRHTILPRTPIFLGCEGESERGYGVLLNRYAREIPGLHLHIQAELLQPGAGDPLALVQRAIQRIADLERRRDPFACKAILLDIGDSQKSQEAQALAAANGIAHLIWQEPDHEGFLLRHLDDCQQLRPPAGTSMVALRRRWADYRKAQTQVQLAQRITMEHIQRACSVEPSLRDFLVSIGVIPA